MSESEIITIDTIATFTSLFAAKAKIQEAIDQYITEQWRSENQDYRFGTIEGMRTAIHIIQRMIENV